MTTRSRLRVRGAALALAPTLLLTGALGSLAGCSHEQPAQSAPVPTDQLLDQGAAHLRAGDVEAAEAAFTTVVEREPDNVYGHYDLGLVAQQTGRRLDAVRHYATALRLDPRYVPALHNLAVLTETEDLRGAVALWRRVVRLQPTDAAARSRLTQAERRLAAS